jgi:hypothetical protein
MQKITFCWRFEGHLTKIAGSGAGFESGSASQKYGSVDPDLYQNVTYPEHCPSGSSTSNSACHCACQQGGGG